MTPIHPFVLKSCSRILNFTVRQITHPTKLNKYAALSQYVVCQTAPISLSTKIPKFTIVCVDNQGKRSTYDVSKTSLYHELGLTMRDLRFQHKNRISVINRKIVIRLQDLKAIICPDAVLLVDAPLSGANSNHSIAKWCNNLPAVLTGSSLYTTNLPFEYRALEAILSFNVTDLKTTLSVLEPEIMHAVSALTDPAKFVVDRSLVHILLKISTRLNAFGTVIREFCEMLDELLECDDDIRGLCVSVNVEGEITRSVYDAFIFHNYDQTGSDAIDDVIGEKPWIHPSNNSSYDHKINLQDEMEMLLESFVKDAEEIQNKVFELKELIENSNTAILINLDSHRNLLLRLEIQLTIGMFSCTLFGMIGMAFGMNLNNAFEEDLYAFYVASGTMLFGAGLTWQYLLRQLRSATLSNTTTALTTLKSVTSPEANSEQARDFTAMLSEPRDNEPTNRQPSAVTNRQPTNHNFPRMKRIGHVANFAQPPHRRATGG